MGVNVSLPQQPAVVPPGDAFTLIAGGETRLDPPEFGLGAGNAVQCRPCVGDKCTGNPRRCLFTAPSDGTYVFYWSEAPQSLAFSSNFCLRSTIIGPAPGLVWSDCCAPPPPPAPVCNPNPSPPPLPPPPPPPLPPPPPRPIRCAIICGPGRPCTRACREWGCSNCPPRTPANATLAKALRQSATSGCQYQDQTRFSYENTCSAVVPYVHSPAGFHDCLSLENDFSVATGCLTKQRLCDCTRSRLESRYRCSCLRDSRSWSKLLVTG